MGDDLDDLLAEHYRRRAEDITPSPALLDRYRRAARPARAWPARLGPAAVAAAVALVVLAGCLLWRGHRASVPTGPAGGTPTAVTPSPSPSRTPATPSASTTTAPRPRPAGPTSPTRDAGLRP
jgi:negative regulator of sigma E activity